MKKLLAVSRVSPWPIRDGMTLRVANLLAELSRGWRITLVSPRGSAPTEEEGSESEDPPVAEHVHVQDRGGPAPVPSESERKPFREAVADLLGRDEFDAALLWVGTEFLAEEFEDLPPAVGDRIDCTTLATWRNRVHERKLRQRLSDLRLLFEAALYERRALHCLRAMVTVGEDDASTLRRISAWGRADGRVHTVPNGVRLDGLPDPSTKSLLPTVLFTGVLSFGPNIRAVRHFTEEVWPLVRRRVPDAVFQVAGRNPGPEIRELTRRRGIRLLPDVPDMAAVQREAWISVAPMRSGSGIKNKVLEGWAAATPVVMTEMATNGLQLDESAAELVTDDPGAMASIIVHLLQDSNDRERRGADAYALAARHHSWRQAAERISGLLESQERNRSQQRRLAERAPNHV